MNSVVRFEQFDAGTLAAGSSGAVLQDFLQPEPIEVEAVVDEVTVEAPQDAIEAERIASQQAIANVADSLSKIERSWAQDFASMAESISHRTSEALVALLPSLMTEFGAMQIAAAVISVVERADMPAPVLLLSADDFDEVLSAMGEQDTDKRIEVRKSPEKARGTASLTWKNGGAELDVSEFLVAAREILRRESHKPTHGADET